LQFGKDENSIDFNLEGAVSGEDNFFIFVLIEVVVDLQSDSRAGVPLLEVVGRVVFDDFCIFEGRLDLAFQFVVEFVVFGLVVAGAPVVQVAIHAMLNFYYHLRYQKNNTLTENIAGIII
jgi:hypothetical protein